MTVNRMTAQQLNLELAHMVKDDLATISFTSAGVEAEYTSRMPDYCHKIDAAWRLINSFHCNTLPPEKVERFASCLTSNAHWYLDVEEEAAVFLAQSFYYAMTGNRVEITD